MSIGNPDIEPLGGCIGAEIRGLDLRHPDPDQIALVQRALRDHLVVFFRDQELTPAQQLAFHLLRLRQKRLRELVGLFPVDGFQLLHLLLALGLIADLFVQYLLASGIECQLEGSYLDCECQSRRFERGVRRLSRR